MFPPKVREKLKYYVYLYVDPRTNVPFYIGKGKGDRAFSHLKGTSESAKAKVISELNKLGKKPRIEILKHGLSEEQALLVEATAIDLLDVKKLTNVHKGHDASRASVEEVVASSVPQKLM